MNKQEFLARLRRGMKGMPQEETQERMTFYSEMIDDRIEEGLSEEAAVGAIMSSDADVADMLAGNAAFAAEKKKVGNRGWVILLLAIGSPVWLSLLVAALAVVFSLYVSLWTVIVSIWSVFASLVACAPCALLLGVAFSATGYLPSGLLMVAAALACTGLAIFTFVGCREATRSVVLLTKWIFAKIRQPFSKREGKPCQKA